MGAAKPVATMEFITPDKAKQMLSRMVNNRKLSDAKMLEYAIDMEQNRWASNGETIKFDADGNLFDGQHRLHACILAGHPFETLVVRGLTDENAFSTIDVGKNRTHGDIFSIAGFPSAHQSSSISYVIYLHRHKMLSWNGPIGRAGRASRNTAPNLAAKLKVMPSVNSIVDKQELLEFALPFRDRIISAVNFAQSSPAKRYVGTALIGGCYFLFCEKSQVDAEAFFRDLGEGVGLERNDPIWSLRDRLLANLAQQGKLSRWLVLGMMLKTWNKRREGHKLRQLKIVEGEEYPFILT